MVGASSGYCWNRGSITLSVLSIFLLTTTGHIAAAAPLDLARVAPAKNLASNQELREDYVSFSTKPYDREDLAISLLIPKDWRDIPITVSAETLQQATDIFIPLTEQRAPKPEPGNALIEVRYNELDMEIGLSDLVDVFLETGEFDVLMRRQGVYGERKVDEALIRTVQEDGTYLARLTFSRHGDRVFLVSGSVEEAHIDQYAKILGAAAVSFSPKLKSAGEFAQPMSTFSSKTTPALSFRYPTPYWTVEELEGYPAGATAASLSLRVPVEAAEDSRTYASIFIEAVEKNAETSPDQGLKKLKTVFEETGFTFVDRIVVVDTEPSLDAPLGKLERWNATVNGLPAEVTLLLLPETNTYISLGLFTMRRNDNLFSWMTAWRVFEIVAGDVTGRAQSFTAVKRLGMPSDKELNRLTGETLADFAVAVNSDDFSLFHTKLASIFQSQATPAKLRSSFRSFAGKGLDPASYKQSSPVLTPPLYVQKDGILKLTGAYSGQPLQTNFELKYVFENAEWKLFGLRVSLEAKESRTESPGAAD